MKKLGLIMIALFSSIAISLSAQSESNSVQQDSALIQTSDTTSEIEKSDGAIDRLVEKAISAKIEDLDLNNPNKYGGTIAFFIIVLPTLITFTAVVLIVFFVLKHKRGRENARFELYKQSIEAGQPLPENFFQTPVKQTSGLQQGLVWTGIGLACFIIALFLQSNVMLFGLIPTFIGLGILIAYFIEKPKNNHPSNNSEE